MTYDLGNKPQMDCVSDLTPCDLPN